MKQLLRLLPSPLNHSTFFLLHSFDDTRLCFLFAPWLLLLSPQQLSYTQLLLKKLLGLGEQKEPPKHASSPKQAALSWLLHPASQGVSRDKAVSAALPPPFPGEKQRERRRKHILFHASGMWK